MGASGGVSVSRSGETSGMTDDACGSLSGETTGAGGIVGIGVDGGASCAAPAGTSVQAPSSGMTKRSQSVEISAWTSVRPASGGMRSAMVLANAANKWRRVSGSQSSSGVLRISQSSGSRPGNSSGVKGASGASRRCTRLSGAVRRRNNPASHPKREGRGGEAGGALRGRRARGACSGAGRAPAFRAAAWPMRGRDAARRRSPPARVRLPAMTLRTAPPRRRRRREPAPWDWVERRGMRSAAAIVLL